MYCMRMTTTESNMKHTHRGTCQACGRPTAMQLRNDKLAKHGYTVDWGFFNGVCCGSECAPLEQERTLTDNIIAQLRDQAQRNDAHADALEAGTVEPKWTRHEWTRNDSGQRKFAPVVKMRAELSDYEAQQCVNSAVWNARSAARHARSHADMLEKLIASRHGQPLMPAEPIVARKQIVVGSRVRLSGRGICEVVELKYKETLFGHRYTSLLHAFCKHASGRIFAVPTRNIRQTAIVD